MRHCAICGKTSLMAATRKLLRGHYNPTNWTRKYPNLQMTRLPDGRPFGAAQGKRVLACTKCLRTLSKPARRVKIKPTETLAKPVIAS